MFETLTLIWTFLVSEEFLWGRCLSFESFLHASRMERRRSGWWTIGGNGVILDQGFPSFPLWHTNVQDWPSWPILNSAWQRNAHLHCLQQRPISTLNTDYSAEIHWFQSCSQCSSLLLSAGSRQMKGDVSGCWSCLSDMFSLIPSPRVVPAGLLSKTASRDTRKKELHTAAESAHVRTLISPQREESSRHEPAVCRNMHPTIQMLIISENVW